MAGYSEVAPDDILNTIPYSHNNSTINVNYELNFNNIQFDTLVFLNLGNKLFTGAK